MAENKNNKIATTLRIDESVYNELQSIAETEVRSVNNLIEFIITKFVREYQEQGKN